MAPQLCLFYISAKFGFRPTKQHFRIIRDNARKVEKTRKQIQDFWFWTDFQKIQKIPFQGDHSKFEFLECCLKNADIPRGAPPWGSCILSQPRNSNFEWSSWKRIFWIFWKCFQNQKSWILRVFDYETNYENPTSSASIEPLCRWSYAHLVDLDKGLKIMVSRPLYDQIRFFFDFHASFVLPLN